MEGVGIHRRTFAKPALGERVLAVEAIAHVAILSVDVVVPVFAPVLGGIHIPH